MTKATFGFAAALVLFTSSAWAEEEISKPDEAASAQTVAMQDGAASAHAVKPVKARAAVRAPRADRDRGAATDSKDPANLTDEEKWLRTREGYRDGGY
jgi:hypothetical protein